MDFPLASPDAPRLMRTVFTPSNHIPQRPRSSPEASPMRRREVLLDAGAALPKRWLINQHNPRPHRLLFNSTVALLADDAVGASRPAGSSPDFKENMPTRITAEKLPALPSRFCVPQAPAAPLVVLGTRIAHFSNIVMRPPPPAAAATDEEPRRRRPNLRWEKVHVVPSVPLVPCAAPAFASPVPARHQALLPMDGFTPEITKAPQLAMEQSPLTPCSGDDTFLPFDEEEHRVLALFTQARLGNVGAVREALQRADVTACSRDEFGNTLLIVGAETGCYPLVKLALRFGVDVNLVNFSNSSALHVAAANGHTRICKALLRRGANSELVNDAGMTCAQMLG